MNDLIRRLRSSDSRRKLLSHDFFRITVANPNAGLDITATVPGQWWHPLHYFPTFLSRSIAILTDISHKSFLADVLNEELGEGNPSMAHERIYIETMSTIGFSVDQITKAEPFAATKALVESYAKATEDKLCALGCVFATEVADLAMVGGIGKLVKRVTGTSTLPWVDIHIQQEPNHVDKVHKTLGESFTEYELDKVLLSAEQHWDAWCCFFDDLSSSNMTSNTRLAPVFSR